MLVGQYERAIWMFRQFARERRAMASALLEHAKRMGLATVDTYAVFAAEPDPASFYRGLHLDPRGNRKVASLLAATLRTHYLPETGGSGDPR
jgi:hypothetical protein